MTTADKLNFIVKSMKADGLTKADIDFSVRMMMGKKAVIDKYYNKLKRYKQR